MKNSGFSKFKNYMTFGSTRQGNVAVVTIVIVIAIVILLNLLVGQLPESIGQFDFSNQKIYDITDTSRAFIAALDEDINLYLLSNDETDKRITKFVNNYAELSDRISVREINTMESPSYLTTFECSGDSLVVECADTGKYTVINYTGDSDALILTTTSYDASYSLVTSEYAFDAEGQLTSAIDYVTGDVSEKVYTLTGHGETEVSANITDLIGKANVGLSDTAVDLLKDGQIPEDCTLLLCHNPATDLADDELQILRDYMAAGGNLFLILNDSALGNFNALMADYGMTMEEGYIGDQTNYLQQYASVYGYYFFYPTYSSESIITSEMSSNSIIMYPRGMTVSEPVRNTITVDPFMMTSENGVSYVDDTNYTAGQFVLGAAASETIDENTTSRFTVITALSFVDEGLTVQFPSAGNLDVFMSAFTQNFEDVENFAIEAKSLQVTYNTITNFGFFSLMFIVVIPLALIIGGLIFWRKRRVL